MLTRDKIDDIDIKEAFAEPHGVVLRELCREVAKDGCAFVEIGPWKGYSTSFIGEVAKEYNGKVYCVDHWKGSNGVERLIVEATLVDVYGLFMQNMEILGLDGVVVPMKMDSMEAVELFDDEFADLIFIDADHIYEAFKKDINAWWPKVKKGGILCGHDCEVLYKDLVDGQKREVERALDQDYHKGLHLHPGVVKALGEKFNDYEIIGKTPVGSSTIWVKRK